MNIQSLIAQAVKLSPSDIGLKNPVTNAQTGLNSVLSTVYIWAGIIAVLVIIIAGIIYTGSQGDASRVKRAREAIIGACAGLVIIMMAFVITQFVVGRF
jgi:type IV secretion system pilin